MLWKKVKPPGRPGKGIMPNLHVGFVPDKREAKFETKNRDNWSGLKIFGTWFWPQDFSKPYLSHPIQLLTPGGKLGESMDREMILWLNSCSHLRKARSEPLVFLLIQWLIAIDLAQKYVQKLSLRLNYLDFFWRTRKEKMQTKAIDHPR